MGVPSPNKVTKIWNMSVNRQTVQEAVQGTALLDPPTGAHSELPRYQNGTVLLQITSVHHRKMGYDITSQAVHQHKNRALRCKVRHEDGTKAFPP